MKRTIIFLLILITAALSAVSPADITVEANAGTVTAPSIDGGWDTLSPIEKSYNSRLPGEHELLKQAGYDILGTWSPTVTAKVDDSYLVGPGDMLRVYIWGDPVDYGAVLSNYDVEVDSDGSIFLKPIGRVSVYGRTLQQIDGILKVKFSIKYKNVELETSPLKLRDFSVYISGFPVRPGAVTVTNLWSAADILGTAGGILPQGSLRNIQLVRESGTTAIDLYDIIISGKMKPLSTKVVEGDMLYVPPIGKTAAVAGAAGRPGIFELLDGDTVEELISYAGGAGFAGIQPSARILRIRQGSSTMIEGSLDDPEFTGQEVVDGDILFLQTGSAPVDNLIMVSGAVANPGLYTASSFPTLGSLIQTVGLLPETDRLTGTITRNSVEMETQTIVFSPIDALRGEGDSGEITLKPNDIVSFYRSSEILAEKGIIISSSTGDSVMVPYLPGISLLSAIKQSGIKDAADMEARVIRGDAVAVQVVLRDILVLGDTALDIDLMPGDKVTITELDSEMGTKGFKVLGQVGSPGVYSYSNEETLSSVLQKAGGFTAEAYPQGIILIRESVRKQQIAQFSLFAEKTRENLSQYQSMLDQQDLSDNAKTLLQGQITLQESLLEEAEENTINNMGRIIVTVPDTLDRLEGSRNDIILQEGDTIFVPEKPMTVSIFGDVGTTAAIPWEANKSVKQYLLDIGGLRSMDYAISIVKYNGKIITEDSLFYGWSAIENQVLEQGDTIIAVKRVTLPSGTAFLEGFEELTDTVYKIVYSLSTAGIL